MTKELEFMNQVRYDEKGLVAVIAQDYHSKKVRMLAYMDEEALKQTLYTGQVHYYSRSRQKLWLKGETSGHYQYLKSISIDCDGDALLMQIVQEGGISCHTGHSTCFYTTLSCDKKTLEVAPTPKLYLNKTMIEQVYETILERKVEPKEGSYTNYLLDQGENKILKKIGEECAEILIAAKDDAKQEVIFEIADFIYHLSVLMVGKSITWEEIEEELRKRHS